MKIMSAYLPKINVLLKIILGILIFEMFIYLSSYCSFIQDDSYISLQYAKNFTEGNGLVFNIGERVEGFTSFLWVMILTIPYLLKINPEKYIQFLSMSFGVFSLVVTYLLSEKILIKLNPIKKKFTYISFLPVILTVLTSTFYYWAVSGMETTFYSFLFLTSIYYFISSDENRNHFYLSILFLILSFLARQEAIILALVYFLISIYNLYENENGNKKINRKARFKLMIFTMTFAISILIFEAFRRIYFGHMFPNTYYAKTGTSLVYLKSGINYTISFLKSYLFYGIVLLLPLLLLINNKVKKITLFLYIILLIYSLYIIIVGGDVLTLYRFFVPILPIIYILFTLFIYFLYNWIIGPQIIRIVKNTIFFILIGLFAYKIHNNSFEEAQKIANREKGLTSTMKSLGLTLKREKDEGNQNLKISATTVGTLKYFSECNVLDMLGLTNEFIAHNPEEIKEISDYVTGWKERKYNSDYILSQEPEYIIFSTREKPSAFAERALFTKPSFYKNYIVTPIFLINSETPINVYKKCSPEQLKIKERMVQNNSRLNYAFINLYYVFLDQFNTNGLDKNLALCDSVVRLAPSYFGEPYRFLAVEYFRRKDYPNAINYANKCLERDSLNFYARLVLYHTSTLINKGEITKTQRVFFEKYFPQLYLKDYFFKKI